jgi:hypothetical protein
MIYKDYIRTSQETQCFLITKPSQLMLFREIIAVWQDGEIVNYFCPNFCPQYSSIYRVKWFNEW